jgi:hypothetical protein
MDRMEMIVVRIEWLPNVEWLLVVPTNDLDWILVLRNK